MLTVPLEKDGRLVGIAQFLNKRDDEDFDPDDEHTALRLAGGLAEKTALFISDRSNFEVLGLSSVPAGVDATVVFCDLTASSIFFQHLTVPTAISCINEYLERQSEIAFSYGGTVDKYIGDGIMFRFNVPRKIRKREHWTVAVEAANEMRRDFVRLKQSWLAFDHPAANIYSRVGVACGEVYLATVGHPASQSITIIGEAVNLASHLCDSAPRDRNVIIVDQDTRRRFGTNTNMYSFRPIATAARKGVSLDTFEVIDESGSRPPLPSP
jgi:class 3 adenylate cyclase